MKFPKRPSTHIKESASWKVLQNSVPSEWIVREVSERDYGIDSYIELVSRNNEVTGDLLSVQLKGTSTLDWNYNEKKKRHEARFSGIRQETINYWMNLPVPVFLFVAEISTKKLFFAPVKVQVRNNYNNFINQKSLSFTLSENHCLGNDDGLIKFIICYIQEKTFKDLVSLSRTLLLHLPQYCEFIYGKQGLDPFLELDEDEELLFVHLYEIINNLCCILAIDWDILSLGEIFKNDTSTWGNSSFTLHNLTMTKILPLLEIKVREILHSVKIIITEYQNEYWSKEEPVIFRKAKEINHSDLKKYLY